jgi:hypothetical protein
MASVFRSESRQRTWNRETDVDRWREAELRGDRWVAILSEVCNPWGQGCKPRVAIEDMPQGIQILEEVRESRSAGARGDTPVAVPGEVCDS